MASGPPRYRTGKTSQIAYLRKLAHQREPRRSWHGDAGAGHREVCRRPSRRAAALSRARRRFRTGTGTVSRLGRLPIALLYALFRLVVFELCGAVLTELCVLTAGAIGYAVGVRTTAPVTTSTSGLPDSATDERIAPSCTFVQLHRTYLVY